MSLVQKFEETGSMLMPKEMLDISDHKVMKPCNVWKMHDRSSTLSSRSTGT